MLPISVSDLTRALSVISCMSENQSEITLEDGSLVLQNSFCTIKSSIPGLPAISGTILLAPFAALIAQLSRKSLVLISQNAGYILITGKRFLAKFKLGISSIPIVPVPDGKIYKLSPAFIEAVSYCIECIDTTLIINPLSFIYFHSGIAEVCDGVAYTKVKTHLPENFELTLPINLCARLAKLEKSSFSKVKISQESVTFILQHSIITCTQINQLPPKEFNDLRRFTSGDTIAVGKAFYTSISRAIAFNIGDVIKRAVFIHISKNFSEVRIAGPSGEFIGNASVKCAIDLSFRVNAAALLRMRDKSVKIIFSKEQNRLQFLGDNMVYIVAVLAEGN